MEKPSTVIILKMNVWDTDGEFHLIEAAFYLPNWLNSETSKNRVFIRRGLHDKEVRAPEPIQLAIRNRILEYPNRAMLNMHQVRVRVPVSIAKVLKYEPCLISLAVGSFLDRDVDSMKNAAKMEKFVSGGTTELGMKIAFGFEMMYQQRRHGILDGKGTSTWEAFRERLESNGSKEYQFKGLHLPPSDNDAWLYDGEDQLKSAVVEREKQL
ncbi:hypothetical protein MKW92_050205 [Papaver armeniacum]|nr:hypothetical protein MKW92_050205 [Papaver armeniacum]